VEPNEFDIALSELEVRVERLRALYEQYFLGIEKIEPGVARKDVDRRFWEIRKIKVRNTAKRFKLQMLIQRYNTLQQYWTKICRQIENGTYIRHLARAKRKADGAPLGSNELSAPVPGARPAAAKEAATREERGAAAQPPKVRVPLPEAIGEAEAARVDRLHKELVAAQQQTRPGDKPISRKALAESLRLTEARLREKYADRQIDFEVVVRDGQASIKPTLRKR
jgi:hypothetical protein